MYDNKYENKNTMNKRDLENKIKKYFPYSCFRPGQMDFMKFVYSSLSSNKVGFVHAPTGLGKTISTLLPAIIFAREQDYKILFLSSRHEHHRIVFDTIKAINEKLDGDKISLMNLVSKKYLCNYEGSKSEDFNEFCSFLKQNQACDYYNKTYVHGTLSPKAKKMIEGLYGRAIDVWSMKNAIIDLCPYEIFLNLLSKMDVVVMDYNYLFNEAISRAFTKKAGLDLSKTIVIIDEAHNLPERVRGMYRKRISSYIFKMIKKEVYEVFPSHTSLIEKLNKDIKSLILSKANSSGEILLSREDLLNLLPMDKWENIMEILEEVKLYMYEKKKNSYSNSFLNFMELWLFEGAYTRIGRVKEEGYWDLEVVYLNVGDKIYEVLSNLAGAIFMSATLNPLEMYADICAVPKDKRNFLSLSSPFPDENRKTYIVLSLTTKYAKRTEDMLKAYANAIYDVISNTSQNVLIFFPSYELINIIFSLLPEVNNKQIILESKDMGQTDREKILQILRERKDVVLGAVVGANFYEGVDFKGEMAKVVIIVGMPFEKPDLMNNSLISYYSNLFGRSKGMDYAYIYPSLNKVIQSAGRIIRDEKDRGVIFFMDERYRYPKYLNFIRSTYSPKFVIPFNIKHIMRENRNFLEE